MRIPAIVGQTIGAAEDLKKLQKAATALEADLFKRFLKEASPKGGMFGDSSKTPGSDIYGDMSRDALADTLAERGTLGIGKAVFQSLAPTIVRQHRPSQAAPATPTAPHSGKTRS